jgi:hypothetical protein
VSEIHLLRFKNVSRDEIIAAIRECNEKLGRCPSLPELKQTKNLNSRSIRRIFGTYAKALHASGLEPEGGGFQVSLEALFLDWGAVVRLLGRIPTMPEYERHSKYSVRPLISRFGKWSDVPRGMRQFAEKTSLFGEWNDVMDVIRAHHPYGPGGYKMSLPEKTLTSLAPRTIVAGSPFYGAPLMPTALAHAPINELGVIYLFGMLAERLGFIVTRIQQGFPDCEAMRQVEDERWQRVRIEFEFESRNFLTHGHDGTGCDLIVCWAHNWPMCPVEVLELKRIATALALGTSPKIHDESLGVFAPAR